MSLVYQKNGAMNRKARQSPGLCLQPERRVSCCGYSPFSFCCKGSITVAYYQPASVLTGIRFLPSLLKKWK